MSTFERDQVAGEAKELAALAQYPLPQVVVTVAEAQVYATLALERRLAWLGMVLSDTVVGKVDA